uniref:VP4 n=1 Tax=Shelly headland virus TaxID=2485879 RepID=A0A3G3BTP7_9VIRU|nr:VP4 [Shelly headland virus]
MGNTVNVHRPVRIEIYGNNNSLDSKTAEKYDQTTAIEGALSIPTGVNPALATFSDSSSMRQFVFSSDFENSDFLDIYDRVYCMGERIKGVVGGTVDMFEKVKKAANLATVQPSRGLRHGDRITDELADRLDAALPSVHRMMGTTFGVTGRLGAGDGHERCEWTKVHRGRDHAADGVDLTPVELWNSPDVVLHDSELTGLFSLFECFDRMTLDEVQYIHGVSFDRTTDFGRREEFLMTAGLGFSLLMSPDCTDEAIFDLTLSTYSRVGVLYRGLYNSDFVPNEFSLAPALPFMALGDRRKKEWMRIRVLWMRRRISMTELMFYLYGVGVGDYHAAQLTKWRYGINKVCLVMSRRFGEEIVDCELFTSVTSRFYFLCRASYVFLRYALEFLADMEFPIESLKSLDESVHSTISDGRLLIETRIVAHRYMMLYDEYDQRHETEEDHHDGLDFLKKKARKLKDVVAGELRAPLEKMASGAEKLLSGWVSHKVESVKRAVSNAMAATVLETEKNVEASADVYGSLVTSRKTIALPSTAHLKKISEAVPVGAEGKVLDEVQRLGGEVGVAAIIDGRQTGGEIASGVAVQEMVNRTETVLGQIGDVRDVMLCATQVVKSIDFEKMLLPPNAFHQGSFPIPTRAYEVSLVDGCVKIPMKSPSTNLCSSATFSCAGLVTGTLCKNSLKAVLGTRDFIMTKNSSVNVTIITGTFFSYSADPVHVGTSVEPDHDMVVNLRVTLAYSTSSPDSSKKLYCGVLVKSPDTTIGTSNNNLIFVPAVSEGGDESCCGSGVYVGRLSLNLGAVVRGGLTTVSDCPWSGTFAVVGAAEDSIGFASNSYTNIKAIQIGVEFGSCILTPRTQDVYYVFNRVRVFDKNIFQFIGRVDAISNATEAPQDVVLAWTELIAPLIPFLPLLVNELLKEESLPIVKARYKIVLDGLCRRINEFCIDNTSTASTSEAHKAIIANANDPISFLARAIISLPFWVRYHPANPLRVYTLDAREALAVSIFSTILSCLPLCSLNSIQARLRDLSADQLKKISDFEHRLLAC